MCGPADDANSPETLASIMLDVGGGPMDGLEDFELPFLRNRHRGARRLPSDAARRRNAPRRSQGGRGWCA
jgi:hypothetical protein